MNPQLFVGELGMIDKAVYIFFSLHNILCCEFSRDMNVFSIKISLLTEFVFICISLNMTKDKQIKHTKAQTYTFNSIGGVLMPPGKQSASNRLCLKIWSLEAKRCYDRKQISPLRVALPSLQG